MTIPTTSSVTDGSDGVNRVRINKVRVDRVRVNLNPEGIHSDGSDGLLQRRSLGPSDKKPW